MKRLHFASLIGLLLIGQIQGASSSSSLVNYRGTIAQLASYDYVRLPHQNMPQDFSSQPISRNQTSPFEQRMKQSIPGLFIKGKRDNIISAAKGSQAYIHYRPGKNIYDYFIWSGGVAALLGLGLYGMHTHDVLSVNWKHILFCASVASAAGIYGSWDKSVTNNSEKDDILGLRTKPKKMVEAVRRLAEGFTKQWTNLSGVLTCNTTPIYAGYFNQFKLGDDLTLTQRERLWLYSLNNANQLPLRDLGLTNNVIDNVWLEREMVVGYKAAYEYLLHDLASNDKLGTILAAEEKKYTIPAAIPMATLAAGVVSGLGIMRDYRLSRIQG